MEFLIANLDEWDIRNNELLSNIGGDVEDYDLNLNKHYILNKYLVDDIKNVPMEMRWLNLIIHYYYLYVQLFCTFSFFWFSGILY